MEPYKNRESHECQCGKYELRTNEDSDQTLREIL